MLKLYNATLRFYVSYTLKIRNKWKQHVSFLHFNALSKRKTNGGGKSNAESKQATNFLLTVESNE